MQSWAQSEAASSESKPRDIPPSQHSKVFSWDDVKEIVDSNRLDVIRRKPSQRVIYKSWCKATIAVHGSITAYMCSSRLHWEPLASSSAETGPVFEVKDPIPFQHPADYRILRNDWPYGSFGTEITHLIVWSKCRIATEPESGLVTPESRALIDDFVEAIFINRLARDEAETPARERVLWFKNWGALQSVPGLEHIHVLVRDVADTIIEEWTGEPGRDGGDGGGLGEHSCSEEKELDCPVGGGL
ncbi:hypothetical protein G7Y79_00036g071970 [Physcia stellaris]|nr:hypothetical protein G7Y79_00036g071970 [Physcia stellaris]